MTDIRRSLTITWLTTLSLCISLSAGLIFSGGTARAENNLTTLRKMARDLSQFTHSNAQIKVLVQLNKQATPAFTAFLQREDVKLEYKYVNFPIYALKV